MSAFAYCRDLVRSAEHSETFLTGLLLPSPPLRRLWFASRALNAELAGVVSNAVRNASSGPSNEKELAMARLTWWKQSVIDVCTGKLAPAHPVLQELQSCSVSSKLSRPFLVRVVDARMKELDRVGSAIQFRSMVELEEFAEQVYSSLR